ncbi:MAG: hypothetical protein A3F26_02255 [Candidatus Ryanbacteria bacterium RIFCSPHIGHO2_12_FULL_47_12b]|uniref:Uncharacterized protein n=2 Tax=Candidatus Ryaniibacteriota TaxID=1817914 RepID=A0A1G2H192_9BACT|nr:MAG: hypothetical protein UX74_C0005G0013 [Parcubacteria group bacterium GW2011_GWA2_47_10b]OGZ44809.1 MAG: hypothetical protein A2844_01260 [Candidatus Ryanbacteria bacterium RIFCSPHIGHO2_01_FULL_48_80]OGZ48937.1 MAG: hypothetical protein A3C83_02875 [Candidatus Ryanbacteria bacterium RIFCSPHIGHO2_02_FULL_47_25]OGZ52487.1 MAG: hypothetical protein A3F26_02255 [Candidatus Ryanbacteria bacterium RIFCSPHIGHO2_12_FULL_47_12b]OGZ56242.1 MAG: hypothetical protein A3G60_01900 [Candidatus Ryanbacte
MLALLTAKPILIGLHLGFAILGIDAFLWLLGELVARAGSASRRMFAAAVGLASFIGSWFIGGYYYVNFYGPLVKPVILKGSAPWAHAIAMEAKEHIFLFVVPMAVTALLLSRLDNAALDSAGLRKPAIFLAGTLAGVGLAIGLMGYIISAAARWGVL